MCIHQVHLFYSRAKFMEIAMGYMRCSCVTLTDCCSCVTLTDSYVSNLYTNADIWMVYEYFIMIEHFLSP